MSLGERICTSRKSIGMSQSDMAVRLQVSRQSVSKWETDASVPELEKLVLMAELFGVSLDELVRGEKSAPCPDAAPAQAGAIPSPAQSPQSAGAFPPRKIVGLVLLSLGFMAGLILFVLTGQLEVFIYSAPFILCGLICLFVKRPTLYCFWALWLLIAVYIYYASGVRIWWAINPFIYNVGLKIQFIIAWALFLPLIALLAVSIRRIYLRLK